LEVSLFIVLFVFMTGCMEYPEHEWLYESSDAEQAWDMVRAEYEKDDGVSGDMAHFFFFYDLIPQLIRRKDYKRAERRIRLCKRMPDEGSYNYHVILLFEAILGISSGKAGITRNAFKDADKEWLFEALGLEQAWDMVRDEYEKDDGVIGGERLLVAFYDV
jgi:cation transport regulator ChaB